MTQEPEGEKLDASTRVRQKAEVIYEEDAEAMQASRGSRRNAAQTHKYQNQKRGLLPLHVPRHIILPVAACMALAYSCRSDMVQQMHCDSS